MFIFLTTVSLKESAHGWWSGSDRDAAGTGGCRSPSKGPQLKRETWGTLGNHCKLITGSRKPSEQSRLAPWVEVWELPQVVGWGKRGGLHSDSDQGQVFEDHPSADLNIHWIYILPETKEELRLPDRKRRPFQPPRPLDDKTVAHRPLW